MSNLILGVFSLSYAPDLARLIKSNHLSPVMEKDKGWLEKVLAFDWKEIVWDTESKVFIAPFKKQRDKVIIR